MNLVTGEKTLIKRFEKNHKRHRIDEAGWFNIICFIFGHDGITGSREGDYIPFHCLRCGLKKGILLKE